MGRRAHQLTNRIVAEPIAAPTTASKLKVDCELDSSDYPRGLKVSDTEMDAIAITGDNFHPEWSYTIASRRLNEAIVLGVSPYRPS